MNDEIRMCYEEESMLRCDGDEFVKMIVLDAIFLLHLFLGLGGLDIPKKLTTLESFITPDIFLSENQIPFFVLKRIYDETFPVQPISLISLTRTYTSSCSGIPGSEDETNVDMGDASKDIAHLVDFVWKHFRSSFEMHKREQQEHAVATTKNGLKTGANISAGLWNKCWNSLFNTQQRDHKAAELLEMTAKQLSDSGVKFMVSESRNPLCITFNKTNGELHVPQLHFVDSTEAVLRNILFFEQSHYYCKDRTCFIDLIVFYNRLISNVKDVQILQQVGILDNHIGSDEALLDLFKKVDKNIIYKKPLIYSNVCQEMNTYANKPWNRWKAILRRDYFNHPWAIISFIFAIILFVLTVIQTITGFTNK